MNKRKFQDNFDRKTMGRIWVVLLVAGLLLASCFFGGCGKKKQIIFLSGAGMKVPVKEIANNFTRKTGIVVQAHFEGSLILRDYINQFKTGDIFLPGDKKNLDILCEKNLVKKITFIAWHKVAILVNPEAVERIKNLDDLAQNGVRLAISNPRHASLGKLVMKKIIERHPKGKEILDNVVVYGSSSPDVIRLYNEGGVDAVIEWDVMAATEEGRGLIVVPLQPPYQVQAKLYAGLLATANDQLSAEKFYSYLENEGREIFKKHGYDIVE